MPFLMILGLVLTIVVWVNFGWVWGLVAGFFLVGGVGWKLLFGLVALVSPNRKQKTEFVDAWEALAGEMQFGHSSTYPPPGLYEEWRRENEAHRRVLQRTVAHAAPTRVSIGREPSFASRGKGDLYLKFP